MKKKNSIILFNKKQVRRHWDEDKELWYFSVVDIIEILTESVNPNNYWKVLKYRLKEEGSQLVTNCNQLKLESSDGKYYKTDVLDTENLLRLIQSIPSPKAEPLKLWLAKVGYERIEETEDPELAFEVLNTIKKLAHTGRTMLIVTHQINFAKEISDRIIFIDDGINNCCNFFRDCLVPNCIIKYIP